MKNIFIFTLTQWFNWSHCQVSFSTIWTGYPVGFTLGTIIIKVMNHWQEF
uniref:Uncharacterized protein n=1 Tax=Octopus bimaculoides TaxID=37653 RepID=A0A0L8HCZ9_OCTBM